MQAPPPLHSDEETNEPFDKLRTSNEQPKEMISVPDSDLLQQPFNDHFTQQYLSSSLPTLFEQLHHKDQQIDQLSKTVHSLIERNETLQKRMAEQESSYYRVDPNYGGQPPRHWGYMGFFSAKHFLLLACLVVFLILSLKAFDYFAAQSTPDRQHLLDQYRDQWQNYTDMTVEYQEKLEALQTEKKTKEDELQKQAYTIDTLSKTLSRVSSQLTQEGKKSETINALTQQLTQKDKEIAALDVGVDSMRNVLMEQKREADDLADKIKVMEAINNLNAAKDVAANNNNQNNLLYFLLFVLLAVVVFLVVEKRK